MQHVAAQGKQFFFDSYQKTDCVMKKIILSILSLFVLAASAQTVSHYGFTPDEVVAEDIQAQGTGENAYVAGMICLDPVNDPVVQRLKGQKVLGVRCYLRTDYVGKRQKFTFVMHATGTPDSIGAKTYCNFSEGWNEILFDEPVTIGDDKLFVGLQVYETRSAAYPLVSYAKAAVPGGSWINLKQEGWKEYTDRGTLFIQALLDAPGEKFERTVYAQATDLPLTIAPAAMFDARVYFHNCSVQPVSSVELTTIGQGDCEPHVRTVSFDEPIPAYGYRHIDLPLRSGVETGAAQWLRINVTAVDGQAAQPAPTGESKVYITHDAFERIPLVEEFTSQRCTNCPFMIYYLDKAMEEFDGNVLYVTHHTGYQKDAFTLPMDEDLLYLFGSDYTYNPAVMYDRRVAKGEVAPVLGANEASTAPYYAAISEAALRPAMARVDVEVDKTDDGQINCRVSGRINAEMAAAGHDLYLSAYLVEDGISLDDKYFQMGLDAEGAPADIMERFKHNGVKRHVFNTTTTGDLLQLDADNCFEAEYQSFQIDKSWVWENCRVIAFVHKMDKEDMTQNEVLNAGSNRLGSTASAITRPLQDATADVRFYVDAKQTLRANYPLASLEVYSLDGSKQRVSGLLSGVYVVRYTLSDGTQGTQKVLVK